MPRIHACAAMMLAAATMTVYALPARRSYQTVTLADGSQVSISLHGDEYYHYYADAAGQHYVKQGDSFVAADAATEAARRAAALSTPRRSPGLIPATAYPATGEQKGLVILVEYTDVKFNVADPNDYFSRMLNEEGFSDYGGTGSARDYFIASSAGMFEPQFDVYGPVTLAHDQKYYGANNYYDQDNAPEQMVIEACRALNPDIDFSEYDRDNDGYIDYVYIYYAGRGEASGGGSDTVWPHSWDILSAYPGQTFTFDGVTLSKYACSNEWEVSMVNGGYRPVGIGPFVHEFSHVLGLPDEYATSYTNSFTPGAFTVMDYGPYNNDCNTPPLYSAFESYALGWQTPQAVGTQSRNIALQPLSAEAADAYIISDAGTNDYYLLENRQQQGWDAYIPGHGMLVWHIDYDEDVWSSNTVNNKASHNYIDLIEADGIRSTDSRGGDPYPGTKKVTTLTPTSWAGKTYGITLTDISERADGVVVMRVNGGAPTIAAPTALEACDITAGSFTARWETVEGAKQYHLYVYDCSGNSPMAIDGYSGVSTGADTQCVVSGLSPSTDYAYAVTATDDYYESELSGIITVTTTAPTLEYYAPTALEAADVTDSSFTARWLALDDADHYLIMVEQLTEGDTLSDDATFDDSVLDEGWQSTAKDYYGSAAYSGSSAPALRMTADGQELVSPMYDRDIRGVTFWCRGIGCADATVAVAVLVGDQWQDCGTYAVETDAGGITHTVNDITGGARQVRLTFVRPTKGSLALDDVVVDLGHTYVRTMVEGYDGLNVGNVTAAEISGLQPESTYAYTIRGANATATSAASNEIIVTTAATSDIHDTSAEPAIAITGRSISGGEPVTVCDITGRIIGRGKAVIVSRPGVYIISGGTRHFTRKVFIK
ncbi:MAG: M6 family metalloprotease domain-containing protein [Muribaculaceae bacterium]